MGFKRVMLEIGRSFRSARAGDSFAANFRVKNFNAQADATITASELVGGAIVQGLTLTSDVVYTLPTGPLLADEWPEMDLGDAFSFYVGNNQAGAFDVVMAVGAGMTAIGTNNNLSIAPQSSKIFTLVLTDKTDGAETFDLY